MNVNKHVAVAYNRPVGQSVIMKVILDIKEDSRIPFFMELVKSLDYIRVIKEVHDIEKSQFIADLAEAFDDVKQHEQGTKKLKSAKALLDEL